MSDANVEDAKKLVDETPQVQVDEDFGPEETKDSDFDIENSISPQQEEEVIKKKYGGLLPKKPPLISKDHERAFFDSADWALGKQGSQKNKGPLEALRPKLEPTHHHQVQSRRSPYAPVDNGEDDGNSIFSPSEDQSRVFNAENDNIEVSDDHKAHRNET